MKFMKLGSKPDLFQSNGENTRYVAAELATDLIVNVGNVKFYLHKFPLLSKSARLQKMVAISSDENSNELQIHDIPGGPTAFEICAKFCYGMTVTLNAYNVVLARCAAEYLEMYEIVDKGNLIYKIEVFLNTSIFRTWKDSIILFQATKSLLPWSEELKIVSRCLDSIASKASIETSRVEWSYTYNRKKLPSENGHESPHYNGVRKQLMVPKDWWVEDLCDLPCDLYKKVITTIKNKGQVSVDVLGESLKAYAQRRLPKRGEIKSGDDVKVRSLVETIIYLLPKERNSVSCDLLVQILQASVLFDFGESRKKELVRKIGRQLDKASLDDIVNLDVDLVQELVGVFMMQDQSADLADFSAENEFLEVKCVDSAAKMNVAKLVDCYLFEIAKDPNLLVSKFADLADMVLTLPRQSHDGIYRAIDMYLKEHPGISKNEKKRICRLMDCRKLSADACMHAVQNERLPLRVVVQVLFFEQIRATTTGSGGAVPPDIPAPIRAVLPVGSHGSSRSATTNTEEEWDSVPTSEEFKALKGELASLRLKDGGNNASKMSKVKGMVMSRRIFAKMFSRKDGDSENGSSDTSESPCSTNAEETKSSTPSRSRRHSLS